MTSRDSHLCALQPPTWRKSKPVAGLTSSPGDTLDDFPALYWGLMRETEHVHGDMNRQFYCRSLQATIACCFGRLLGTKLQLLQNVANVAKPKSLTSDVGTAAAYSRQSNWLNVLDLWTYSSTITQLICLHSKKKVATVLGFRPVLRSLGLGVCLWSKAPSKPSSTV